MFVGTPRLRHGNLDSYGTVDQWKAKRPRKEQQTEVALATPREFSPNEIIDLEFVGYGRHGSRRAPMGRHSPRQEPKPFANADLSSLPVEHTGDDLDAVSPQIQLIRPNLHHLTTFGPEFSRVGVRALNRVCFLVRQLSLDRICVPSAHFVEPDCSSGAEAVGCDFVLAVTKAAQGRIERVFRHRARGATHRWEQVSTPTRKRLKVPQHSERLPRQWNAMYLPHLHF
jgi:hypothetical protein